MKKPNNKGVTLLILVVTIIVIIILAGVTINMMIGENGIIGKTDFAKKRSFATTIQDRVTNWRTTKMSSDFANRDYDSRDEMMFQLYKEGYLTKQEFNVGKFRNQIEIGGQNIDFGEDDEIYEIPIVEDVVNYKFLAVNPWDYTQIQTYFDEISYNHSLTTEFKTIRCCSDDCNAVNNVLTSYDSYLTLAKVDKEGNPLPTLDPQVVGCNAFPYISTILKEPYLSEDNPQIYGNAYSYEFTTNTDALVFQAQNVTRILVDEGNGYQYVDFRGFGQGFFFLDFGEGNIKERNIKVELWNSNVQNIFYKNIGDIYVKKIEKPEEEQKLALFVTDYWFNNVGYTQADKETYDLFPNFHPDISERGTMAAECTTNLAHTIANAMGYSCITTTCDGYHIEDNDNGRGANLYKVLRFELDDPGSQLVWINEHRLRTLGFEPDVVFIAAGGLDINSNTYGDELAKYCKECVQYVHEQCPNAEVIVIGPQYWDTFASTTRYASSDEALKRTCFEQNAAYIDIYTGETFAKDGTKLSKEKGSYITGTGQIGNSKYDGNADSYITSIWLSAEGQEYLGRKLVIEVQKIFKYNDKLAAQND